jgi:hypothetical protein
LKEEEKRGKQDGKWAGKQIMDWPEYLIIFVDTSENVVPYGTEVREEKNYLEWQIEELKTYFPRTIFLSVEARSYLLVVDKFLQVHAMAD